MTVKEYEIKITIDEQIDQLLSKLNKLRDSSTDIKFNADITKLEKQLNDLAKQTKVDTTNFTKLQREVNKVDKSISSLDKDVKIDVDSKPIDNIKNSLNSIPKTLDINIGGTTRSFNSVRQAIKELTQDLLKLKSTGQGGSPLYNEISSQLGELKRLQSQVQGSINSSKTFGLSKYTSAIEGLTAVSSVSSGISGLFGFGGNDFQKTLEKFSNMQMILSGLQTLNQQLNNSSSLLSKLVSKISALGTVTTKLFKSFRMSPSAGDWLNEYNHVLEETAKNQEGIVELQKKLSELFINPLKTEALQANAVESYTRQIEDLREGIKDLNIEKKNLTKDSIFSEDSLVKVQGWVSNVENLIAKFKSKLSGFFDVKKIQEAIKAFKKDKDSFNIDNFFNINTVDIDGAKKQYGQLTETTSKWMSKMIESGKVGQQVLLGIAKTAQVTKIAITAIGNAAVSLTKKFLAFYAVMKISEVAFTFLDNVIDHITGKSDKLEESFDVLSTTLEYFNKRCEDTIDNLNQLKNFGTINPITFEEDKLKAYADLLKNINTLIPKSEKPSYGWGTTGLDYIKSGELNKLQKEVENYYSGKSVDYNWDYGKYIGNTVGLKAAIYNLFSTAEKEIRVLKPKLDKYLAGDESYKAYYDKYVAVVSNVKNNILVSLIDGLGDSGKALKDQATWFDKAAEAIGKYNGQLKEGTKEIEKNNLKRRQLLAEINDDEVEKLRIQREQSIAEDPSNADLYKKLFKKQLAAYNKSKAEELKSRREQLESERKQRIENRRKLENEINNATIALFDEGLKKRIAELNQKEKEAIEGTDSSKLKELYKKKFAKDREAIKEAYNEELVTFMDNFNYDLDTSSISLDKDKLKRDLETRLNEIFDKSDIEKYYREILEAKNKFVEDNKDLDIQLAESNYANQLSSIEKWYNSQLKEIKKFEKEHTDAKEIADEARFKLDEEYNRKLTLANKKYNSDIAQSNQDAWKESSENIVDYYTNYINSLPTITKEIKEKILKELSDLVSNKKISQGQSNSIQDLFKKKDNSTWFSRITEWVDKLLPTFQFIFNSITDSLNTIYDSQLDSLQDEYDLLEEQLSKQEELVEEYTDRINDIEEELSTARGDRRDRLIQQYNEEKAARLEALKQQEAIQKEEEANKKRQEAVEKQQKKVEKASAIAQATISTYQAAANALAIKPYWLGAVLAGVALATGLGYVGVIASTKYAKGGLLNGPSHSNGGIKTPFGELEGNEYVINKKTTSKNLPLLSYINSKDKELSSKDLLDFFNSNKTKDTLIKPMYASGGYLPNKGVVYIEDTRPIEVSVVDIINKSNNVRKVQVLSGQ